MILSSDSEFVITTDIVATICEPITTVKDMYNSKTSSLEVEEEVPLSEAEVLNG